MKLSIALFLTICCLSFMYSIIINVPADQPTIQAGIDESVHGDTVLVQPGTYFENINYNGKNITLTSMFLTSQDTTYISQTTIDGNQNGSVITFDSGEDSTAVLCGFTIKNGLGTEKFEFFPPEEEWFYFYYGGGIYCHNSSPYILFNVIENNEAYINYSVIDQGFGGGICLSSSSSKIVNNNISNNFAYDGAGISISYTQNTGPVMLVNNNIFSNHSEHSGGAIFFSSYLYSQSTSIIKNNIFNNTSNFGGAIFMTMSNPIFINMSYPQKIFK